MIDDQNQVKDLYGTSLNAKLFDFHYLMGQVLLE